MQLSVYESLPVDLRIMALGLPLPKLRGRPRALTFRQRLEVVITFGEILNDHAREIRDRQHERRVAKLQAKWRRLSAENAPPHKLAEVSRLIDIAGRFIRIPIAPPEANYPAIDKAVAKKFGITERMVRRCRMDPRLRPFMPHPVWEERDHERKGRLEFAARQLAERLMTPARLAKRESIGLVNGSIKVLDTIDHLSDMPCGLFSRVPSKLGSHSRPRSRSSPGPARVIVWAVRSHTTAVFRSVSVVSPTPKGPRVRWRHGRRSRRRLGTSPR